ncbi:hypothetical protein [Hyalangium sp.]|uniref:hypothetical protein n=1 Tax=Hyalangium sp. TaxID=2028555 RepID=UPI002D3D1C5E|nr:hypothetical protein [Hyalangium sp.]HYH98455.1 hypothetical protein [Hyalangium sp.]
MKLLRPCLGGLLAVGLLLVPVSSQAANIRLGLGADYWFDEGAAFQFNLGVETHLAGPLHLGGRFGIAFLTEPSTLGIPIDLVLRFDLTRRFYLEGLVGPWIVIDSGETLRAHAAFGFGIRSGALTFGLEVGYASPEPILGVRLGYRF